MGAELRVQEFTAGGQSVSVLWLPADTLWPDSMKSQFILYSADLTHNYCILSAWALAPSPLQEPSCWSRQQWYVSETYRATLCMTNSIGQFPQSKQKYTMNKHTIYPLPRPHTHILGHSDSDWHNNLWEGIANLHNLATASQNMGSA